MSFNSLGAYSQVIGATTALPGQTIQSVVWNNIHNDLGLSLSQETQEFMSQPSNRNIMWMNGGFEVWQRGADSTSTLAVAASTTAYTADRWYMVTQINQASVVSAQPGLIDQSRLSARVQRNNAQVGIIATAFAYPLDTDEIVRCRGKLVTLSFVVQAGANFSPANGTLNFEIFFGTGANPAKRGFTPYAGETVVIAASFNLTPGGAATTVAFISNITVPLNATQGEILFFWVPTGTAGANDWVQFDDVQLEVNVAPNFTWIPTAYDRMSFPEMLKGCKRHYQKTFNITVFTSQGGGRLGALQVISNAASKVGLWWEYPVEMRVTAVITTYNPDAANANWQNITAAATSAATIDTSTQGSKSVFILAATAGATDQFHIIQAQGDAGI